METIKNYLESMFASLPNTAEVLRAKNELYSMMEDKYNELISDGKAENEAVGIVISEFGNLDEVAESLGIGDVMKGFEPEERHMVSFDEAKDYIADQGKHMFMIGLAVMIFILSPIPVFAIDGAAGVLYGVAAAVGPALLLMMIAIGVGMIVYSSVKMNKWDFLNEYPCSIEYSTAEYIYREQRYNRGNRALLLTVGIMLCVVSVVPSVIFGAMGPEFLSEFVGPVFLFILAGLGVMMIIYSTAKESAYKKLLSLNDRETVSGSYESTRTGGGVRIENPTVKSVMSVYWNTVTAIYLIWSFLTFHWYKTWIIWPIAGVVSWAIKSIWGDEGSDK